MHETLVSGVKGHIDKQITVNGIVEASGWILYNSMPILRVVAEDEERSLLTHERSDVISFYESDGYCVGWTVSYSLNISVVLQIDLSGEWHTVFVLQKNVAISPQVAPSFVVVDGFYAAPDDVRALALRCVFHGDSKYHKGARTAEPYRFPGLKERFEQILGRPVLNWDKYATNGCFQFCVGGDQIVYHNDLQQYAGVLYLTPNAPVGAGTSLYRSRKTGSMIGYGAPYAETFPTGHLDPAPFECVDVVGNVYNRLILFDSRMIHAATSYFGNSKENGRLFQLFFFDVV
jgi:hypothetical protein